MKPDYDRGKAEKLFDEGYKVNDRYECFICVYCKFYADTYDHVPSLWMMWQLHFGGGVTHIRWLYPACQDCNLTLGKATIHSINGRRQFVLKRYRERRRKPKNIEDFNWLNERIQSIERFKEGYPRIQTVFRSKPPQSKPSQSKPSQSKPPQPGPSFTPEEMIMKEKERKKRYYEANKEKLKAYYRANSKKIIDRQKDYNQKNYKENIEKQKKYRDSKKAEREAARKRYQELLKEAGIL